MIVEWFADFCVGLFGAFIDLIPWPTTLVTGFAPAFGVMGTFNSIFPVTEAFQGATLVLGFTSALFLYRVLKVAVSHIPYIGGSG